MFNRSLAFLVLLIPSIAFADYFYFWSETYEAYPDPDGRVWLNTKLKSSEATGIDFSVADRVISENQFVPGEEIVDFPLTLGKRYTDGQDHVVVCAFKRAGDLTFKQEICLKIKIVR